MSAIMMAVSDNESQADKARSRFGNHSPPEKEDNPSGLFRPPPSYHPFVTLTKAFPKVESRKGLGGKGKEATF